MFDKIKKIFTHWGQTFSLFVAVGALIVNVFVFNEGVRTNKNLNRPYIEIDTSQMKELDVYRINPDELEKRITQNLPIPYVNYLDFSIKNVGKLPAKYLIDVSEFKELGMTELIPQTNDKGFIFPGQSISVSYYIKGTKGETNSEQYREDIKKDNKRKKELISGDNTNASRIRVKYENLDDIKNNLDFETTIEERMIEKGGDLPNERIEFTMVGYSREWFVVSTK